MGSETELAHLFVSCLLSENEKTKLKVSVVPVIVKKTKQVTKTICSGFRSHASIPTAVVKLINSCEALRYVSKLHQCIP